jgi:hypothetical protein
MEISGEMRGNKLHLVVTFDEPGQVPVFHEYFENMLNSLAKDHGGEMMDGAPNGPVSKKDIQEQLKNALNKFGGL